MRQTILALLPTLLLACGTAKNQKQDENQSTKPEEKKIEFTQSDFTDPRDGYIYSTITYPNGQTWMNENIIYFKDSTVKKYHKFKGEYENIPYLNVKCSDKECKGHKADTYEPSEHAGLGLLYDYEAARLACPKGWHLASIDDWRMFAKQYGLTLGSSPSRALLPKDNGLNLPMSTTPELADNGSKYQSYWALSEPLSVMMIIEGYILSISQNSDTYNRYLPCRCVKD